MMKPLFTLGICLFFSLTAWTQNDYRQWECVNFRVKNGQEASFEKAMANHNHKYHPADPYKTSIFEVITGPNSGTYFLALGAMRFSQMDGRPSGEDHDSDWSKNVLPHVESTGEVIYWRADKDISYMPAGSENWPISRFRYFTSKPGEGDRFKDNLMKLFEVYKAKEYPVGLFMYWRNGASTGPNIIVELNYPNWAAFDHDRNFRDDFQSVHSQNDWERFLEEIELSVDREKTYDELVRFRQDLSSPR